MASPNFIKFSLLQALHLTHHYITFLSDASLDSSISNEDERISIDGYSLQRVDHPNNKNGRCLYVLWRTSTETTYAPWKMSSYRNHSEQKSFIQIYVYIDQQVKLKKNLRKFCIDLNFLFSNINNLNILLSVITGDFNARSSNWQSLNKGNAEGQKIISLTSAYSYNPKN